MPTTSSDSATKALFTPYTQLEKVDGQNVFSSFFPVSTFFFPGLILGSKTQTGIMQYEAVELLFCLSFLLVLSQHRPLYKDLITHLYKRMYLQEITQEE